MKTYTAIYTSIPCDFWESPKGILQTTDFAKNDNMQDYTVVLDGTRTLVRAGMKIELISSGVNFGVFEIHSIQHYQDITWAIDNIELKVKKINA